jgi:hypothetical protein
MNDVLNLSKLTISLPDPPIKRRAGSPPQGGKKKADIPYAVAHR